MTYFLSEPTNISAELDNRANWHAQSTDCTPSIPHIQTQEYAQPRKVSALWLWQSFTAPAQSQHHRQQRPTLYLSLLSSAKKVRQVNNRKNTWIIYNLSNHKAQRCAPPHAGHFGDYCWAQCNSQNRTKPAFPASSEPMGEFHTILYLPVRRHTYRMAKRMQPDSRTGILSGILKKSREA